MHPKPVLRARVNPEQMFGRIHSKQRDNVGEEKGEGAQRTQGSWGVHSDGTEALNRVELGVHVDDKGHHREEFREM